SASSRQAVAIMTPSIATCPAWFEISRTRPAGTLPIPVVSTLAQVAGGDQA
ncbi:MAG: hypothetical protein RL698_1890, partial [Pseudomonadota bacterium]